MLISTTPFTYSVCNSLVKYLFASLDCEFHKGKNYALFLLFIFLFLVLRTKPKI